MKQYINTTSLIFFISGLFLGSMLHCSPEIVDSTEKNNVEIPSKETQPTELTSLSPDQYDFIRYNDKTSLFFNDNSSLLVKSELNKIKEYVSLFSSKSVEVKISAYCSKSEKLTLGQSRLSSVIKELPSGYLIKEENNCSKAYPREDKDSLNRKVILKISRK